MKIKVRVTTNWYGAEDEDELVLDDDMSPEEIEKYVSEWAWDVASLDWTWEIIEDK